MAFGPYKDAINRAAAKYGVPAPLLAGLLAQESGFRPGAIGDNGASVGMGQFNIHGALADFKLSREQVLRMTPEQQIDLTANFYRQKIDQAGGDPLKGLVRYNGGGDPNYLQHVLSRVPRSMRGYYKVPAQVDVRMAGATDNAGMPVPTGDPVTGEADLDPVEIFNALQGIQQTAQQQYDETVASVEEKYPIFNPDSDQFDESLADSAATMMQALKAQGLPAHEALNEAVEYTLQRNKPASLYWGDELLGGLTRVDSMIPDMLMPDTPRRLSRQFADPMAVQQESRNALAQAREQYPGLTFGGEVAGGIGQAVATRGPTKAVPLPLLGAAEGGIAGAGSGNSVPSRVNNALIGMAFGAGVPTAMNMLGGAARSIGARVGERLRPEGAGRVLVRRAAEADDMTADDILRAMDQLGPEAMPADVGTNLRMLTKQAANAPGPAARIVDDAMTTRQAGAVQRVLGAAGDDVMPTGAQGYGEFLSDLQTQLKQQARPWYDKAYAGMVPKTPAIRQLMADYPDAHRAAIRKAKTDPTVAPNVRQVIAAMDSGRDVDEVPMQYVDLFKRAMDDKIGRYKRTGANDEVRILTARKNMLLRHLDDMGRTRAAQQMGDDNPFVAYSRARSIYAGGKEMEEAAMLGASALRDTAKTTIRQLQSAVDDMTESEMYAFRIGMMDAIEEKVARAVTETQTPADVASKLMRTADLQKRLSLAFKGREAQTQRFLDRLRAESHMKFTYNQTRPTVGSQTGQLNAANEELAGQLGVGAAIVDAARGAYGGAVQMLIGTIAGKRRQRPEVMAAVARILTKQNISRQEIEQIMRAGDALTQQLAGKAPVSRAVTRAGVATAQAPDEQQ